MKNAILIGTGALLLLFGISAPAFAQEQHDPQEQPAKPPDAKPTHDEHPRPENAAKPPQDTDRKPEAQQAQRNEHPGNGRIPDDKYRAHFGREHTFHVGHPVVVEGRPRFQYGGYSFILVQPWPAGWGYNDDVYIVDVNGAYYLVDVAHPGVQLSLQVIL